MIFSNPRLALLVLAPLWAGAAPTRLPAQVLAPPATATAAVAAPSRADYQRLADESRANLQSHVLDKWFPAAIDRQGGFHQNFGENWARMEGNERSIVYQSRLTWISAQAALRFKNEPERAAQYRAFSRHGLEFLEQKMWDKAAGGLFWEVDPIGCPTSERGGEKHAYGIAFAIYAATANYEATRDARALSLARRAFEWLERHAHDGRNGGYYEALTREGKPILRASGAPGAPAGDAIGTRYGFKSMNTHIHLLEAFSALYEVAPQPLVRRRLEEVLGLVRDRIAVAPGALSLYFTPDWRAVPDHDSYGHDIETAFLLAEASAALGRPDDARTWIVARSLVDNALSVGWDAELGGFYDAGTAFKAPDLAHASLTRKVWWVQAEGLNALLLMHERFGRGDSRYWEAFTRQWNWIETRQIDAQNGGWHPELSREGVAQAGRAKSDKWTEAYHQGRALLHVSEALERLARGEAGAQR